MKWDQVRGRRTSRVRACTFAWSLLCGLGCTAESDAVPGSRPSGVGADTDGAAGGESMMDEADAPSFGEVYAMFEGSCGGGRSGCHVTGTAAELGLPDEASAYDALVEVASGKCAGEVLVAPGDPDASILVQVLEGTSSCAKAMPLGREPLSADQIATVRAWIDAGAPRE